MTPYLLADYPLAIRKRGDFINNIYAPASARIARRRGSSIRFRATTASIGLNFYQTSNKFDLVIDGVYFGSFTSANISDYGDVTLFTGIDNTTEHQFDLVFATPVYVDKLIVDSLNLSTIPDVAGTICFIGDSTVLGLEELPASYTDAYLVADALNLAIWNLGINGAGVVDRGNAYVDGERDDRVAQVLAITPPPSIVVICYGTNDLSGFAGATTAPQFATSDLNMVTKISAGLPDALILCQSILPFEGYESPSSRASFNAGISDAVLDVNDLNDNTNCIFVNLDLIDYDCTEGVDTLDGLHPNAAGYAKKTSATLSALDFTAPSVPSGLAGVGKNEKVTLSWDANVDDTASYELDSNGEVDNVGDVTTYTKEGLENGTESIFRLRAIDGSGNASAWSSEVTVIPSPITQADKLEIATMTAELVWSYADGDGRTLTGFDGFDTLVNDVRDAVWSATSRSLTDKVGFSLSTTPPTANDIATVVESRLLNDGDGQMLINAIVGAIGNQNIDQLALVAAVRADIERNGGALATIFANYARRTGDYATPGHVATVLASLPPAPDNDGITAIRAKTDALPTAFSDATLAKQNAILSAISEIPTEGGGSGGTGANTWEFVVNDANGQPIEGAKVRLTRNLERPLLLTDSDGEAAFAIDDGTWAYSVTASGYAGETGEFVVSGDGNATVELSAIVIPAPVDPEKATVYVHAQDFGVAGAGRKYTFTLTQSPPIFVGDGLETDRSIVATTNSQGNAIAELYPSSTLIAEGYAGNYVVSGPGLTNLIITVPENGGNVKDLMVS